MNCTLCQDTGAVKITSRETVYCRCPIGRERWDFAIWFNRMAPGVNPNVGWLAYMQGKIAGSSQFFNQNQGSPL